MASQAQPQPGLQVTGDDSQDLALIIQSAIQNAHKQSVPAQQQLQQQTQQEPTPSELKVSVFGEERSFKTLDELGKAIEQGYQNVYQQAFQQAQAAGKSTSEAAAAGATAAAGGAAGFDREQFAKLLETDTLKGLEYALGHLFFGGKVTEGVGQMVGSRLQDVATQKQILAAYQFREMFPNLQIEQGTLQKLDQLRQHLGMPQDDPRSWEAAYSVGVMRGILPPPKQEQQQTQQQQQAGGNTQLNQNQMQQLRDAGILPTGGPVVPPAMGRFQAELPQTWVNTLAQAEEMPTAALEKAINDIIAGQNPGLLLGR